MTKTHLAITSPTGVTSACNRGARMDTNFRRVDCLNCQKAPEYARAYETHLAAVEKDYADQKPRQVRHMMDNHIIQCRKCMGVLYKERPRTLFSFHFVCVECGTSVHPPTETGMCQ